MGGIHIFMANGFVDKTFLATIALRGRNSIVKITRTCLWVLPLMILTASFGLAQEDRPDERAPQISVRMALPKKVFTVGEILRVKVQISNIGNKPVLVSNILSMSPNSPSHIEFELRDDHGGVSPSLKMIADTFSSSETASPSSALLGSWLLLNQGYSLAVEIKLDKELFEFLGKPGSYTLSGRYFSAGLFYPPTYRQIGLTEQDVKSVMFQSWNGNTTTNTLSFEVVPGKRHK